MLDFDFRIELPNADEIAKEFGCEPYGRAQTIVDSTIVMYSAPYTPRDTGELQGSVNASIGSGKLVYSGGADGNRNYASYVWNGVSKNGKPLNYQKKNPLAGKEWVLRAMADHLEDVCRIVEKELRNGR